ncbi:MAG: peptidoglycan DD-metalloendopeptidase family protein [Candidatus Kaiserbacteria bacterium]|nr:peptidoglycan DD-metalloendopeptidase family protein [Candidatus Kaiserbacteria bacterium]
MEIGYGRYVACVLVCSGLFFVLGVVLPMDTYSDSATITSTTPVSGSYVPLGSSSSDEGDVVLLRENSEIASLRSQIGDRETRIRATEEEIRSINAQLGEIYKKKDSLEGKLHGLTLTQRRNEAQIRKAEDGIQQGQLKLKTLDTSIVDNAENLEVLYSVLRRNFQQANEFELHGKTLILLHTSFSDVLQRVEEIERYSKALHTHLRFLEEETVELEQNKKGVVAERLTLERQQKELEDRKKIYEFSIKQQEQLVKQTRNDEAVYQRLLQGKQEERLKLQQDIYEYESRIEYLRDPRLVPGPKKGLLRMPFTIKAPLTQRFGETAFARANALRYGRPFHDGMDFGLPTGTQIFSSADGVVIGTGNTDLVPSCYSWGKWVVVKHGFGLSTLYAHLSLVKVRLGQKVKAGELLGYSGNTGFSTGPHLHFGVYDSSGLRIVSYEQVSRNSRCRGLIVPVAAQEAKLDPSKYLPL